MNNKILSYIFKFILLATISVSTVPVLADAVSDQIENLIKQGQLTQALSLTNKQLNADGGNVNYLFLKGLILTRQDRLDDAKAIFIKLTEEHPELPEPFNNLAVIYAAQGDFNSARQALQKAINTHPAYATAHENLGDIYAKMASRAYNQALELDQDNATAREKLLLVSNLFSVQEQEQQAEQARQLASAAKQKSADLDKIEQQLQQTRDQTAQELDKANRLKQQTQDIQTEQARVIAELEAKRTEAERSAKDAVARAQAASDKLAELRQQVSNTSEQTEQERHSAEQQLASLKAEIDARNKELSQVTQKRDSVIEQAQAEQKQAEEQARQARAAAVQASQDLAVLEQKRKELNATIAQQSADAEARQKQAQDRLNQIQADIRQRQQDRQEIIGQVAQERNQAMTQIDDNRTELDKVNKDLARLKAERETLERQNQQLLAKLENSAQQKQEAPANVVTKPNKQDVIEAVNNWAKKWSSKDVEGYLSAYSNDFKPSDGTSRAEWAAQRRDRLRKPRFIRVGVGNIQVKFIGDEHARVTFEQDYRSDNYNDHVEKTLLMAYRKGRWLIAEEISD